MRTKIRTSRWIVAVVAVGLVAGGSRAGAEIVHLKGTLVPQASTPTPTGSGFATIDIDTVARSLVFASTFTGLNNNVSASHIHAQSTSNPYVFPTGANWTVALNFSGMPQATSGTYGPFTYTPANLSTGFVTAQGGNANTAFDNFVTFLRTGQAYFNLHTSLNSPTAGAGNPGGSLGAFFVQVPEIDPSAFGSVLALVVGSLGLVERRAARLLAVKAAA